MNNKPYLGKLILQAFDGQPKNELGELLELTVNPENGDITVKNFYNKFSPDMKTVTFTQRELECLCMYQLKIRMYEIAQVFSITKPEVNKILSNLCNKLSGDKKLTKWGAYVVVAIENRLIDYCPIFLGILDRYNLIQKSVDRYGILPSQVLSFLGREVKPCSKPRKKRPRPTLEELFPNIPTKEQLGDLGKCIKVRSLGVEFTQRELEYLTLWFLEIKLYEIAYIFSTTKSEVTKTLNRLCDKLNIPKNVTGRKSEAVSILLEDDIIPMGAIVNKYGLREITDKRTACRDEDWGWAVPEETK